MQKNRIELAGYLAAKPEVRYLPSGTKVANARLGESYKHRGQDGQMQTHTNWHNLTFYEDLADIAITYEQGENVFIEGTVQQRKFTPKDGVTRTVHEIIVRSSHLIERSRIEHPVINAVQEGHDHPLTKTDDLDEGDHDATWPV